MAIGLFLIGTTLRADFIDSSKKETIITTAEAKNAADDSWVTLKGQIVKKLGGDDFLFKDETGEIKIDVSKNAWKNQDITPDMTIIISGKVDQDDYDTVEIDVKNIEIVRNAPAAPGKSSKNP